MEEVSISEFQANCVSLLEEAHKTQKPLRITRFGKHIADIVPVAPDLADGHWFGSMKGTFEILGDIVSPASDGEVLDD